MKDQYGREIDYMRISITDRCNLRCRYCMPEGVSWIPMEEILTYEDITAVCREAVLLGITRFKITGGEPLVRRGCAGLIRQIRGIPGVKQVTLTTNGILLGDLLEELQMAGLESVNISLDTLMPERFAAITGNACLDRVLSSIRRAEEAGMNVKINTLLQPGINDDEWQQLVEIAADHRIDVRFIEMMPIGYGKECAMISNEQLLKEIRERYPGTEPDEQRHGNGPAVYYRIPGFVGSIGLISAIHGKFCGSCNRIRMTATGELKPCLCYQDSISVREAARRRDRGQIRNILETAVRKKTIMHCFEIKNDVTELRKMAQIGG